MRQRKSRQTEKFVVSATFTPADRITERPSTAGEQGEQSASIRTWSRTESPLANENWVISEELSSDGVESPQSSLSAHFQAPLSQLQHPMWVCSKPIKVRKCFLLFPPRARLHTLIGSESLLERGGVELESLESELHFIILLQQLLSLQSFRRGSEPSDDEGILI